MRKSLFMDKLYFLRNIIKEKNHIVFEKETREKCMPNIKNFYLIEEKTSGINREIYCVNKAIDNKCFKNQLEEFDSVILNAYEGYGLRLYEADEIISKIKKEGRYSINIIVSWTINSTFNTYTLLKMSICKS